MRAVLSGSPSWSWEIYSQLIGFRRGGGAPSEDHVLPKNPSGSAALCTVIFISWFLPSVVLPVLLAFQERGGGEASCGDRPSPLGGQESNSGRRTV